MSWLTLLNAKKVTLIPEIVCHYRQTQYSASSEALISGFCSQDKSNAAVDFVLTHAPGDSGALRSREQLSRLKVA